MEPRVQLRNVKKYFGKVCALSGVNFDLYDGEVVALIGDNGAGKSTLVKILSGYHPADGGEMKVNGKSVDWKKYSVAIARDLGIETVYQERSLAEQQPLWRNVFVGRPLRNRFGLIDVKREKEETMKILSGFLGLKGVGLRPEASVQTLSGGERQGLSIARAMFFHASVVILDEPSTALAVSEVKKVEGFIRQIREQGRSCLLITHDMGQVMALADRYVLIEHGTVGATWRKGEVTEDQLIQRLIHRSSKAEVSQ